MDVFPSYSALTKNGVPKNDPSRKPPFLAKNDPFLTHFGTLLTPILTPFLTHFRTLFIYVHIKLLVNSRHFPKIVI